MPRLIALLTLLVTANVAIGAELLNQAAGPYAVRTVEAVTVTDPVRESDVTLRHTQQPAPAGRHRRRVVERRRHGQHQARHQGHARSPIVVVVVFLALLMLGFLHCRRFNCGGGS